MALSFYNLNLSKKMALIFKKSFNKKNNINIQLHQKNKYDQHSHINKGNNNVKNI
jgi:hypothetical protein